VEAIRFDIHYLKSPIRLQTRFCQPRPPLERANGKGFVVRSESTVFEQLMSVIADRKTNPSERSYTTKLFTGGVEAIGGKIIEEAAEVVDAASHADTDDGRDHLVHEAADLIYHLFVMLGYREIPLATLEGKLAARFGVSGLDEKASRSENT
jgi:phosphoribosyl-ATP pyrophosphohydrolase